MEKLTLEEAQRIYWYYVPWILDEKDLKVINHFRKYSEYKAWDERYYTNLRGLLWQNL